jgi:hypothetical protein
LLAADSPQGALRHAHEVFAVQQYTTADLSRRHRDETHDRSRSHALAATAFADQPDDFRGLDGEAYPSNG